MTDKIIKPIINIHVIVDTDLVLQSSSSPPGSGDARAVTSIHHGHAFTVVTGAARAALSGAREVALDTGPDAAVRFFVTSGSNNFEHTVLLRDIHRVEGDEVLTSCEPVTEDRMGIAPGSATSVFPEQIRPHRFPFHHCGIAGEGTGSYRLVFALWDRGEAGQPSLVGHYQWDWKITVHLI